MVSGQTTEARVWGQPKGSGLHLWSWGVNGEVTFGSCVERGRPEAPGRAQKREVGRWLKIPSACLTVKPRPGPTLGFTKGMLFLMMNH